LFSFPGNVESKIVELFGVKLTMWKPETRVKYISQFSPYCICRVV